MFQDKNRVYVLDGGLDHYWRTWVTVSIITNCGAHQQFIDAGAEIIMTNSYHCSIQKMQEVRGYTLEQAEQSIARTVDIARQAIHTSKHPQTLLVGAVGPYATYLRDGSEYSGAYTKKPGFDPQTIVDFYLKQCKPLVEAGIKCLVFETIPTLIEVKCVGKVLDQLDNSIQAWVVVTCEDGLTTRSGIVSKKCGEVYNTTLRKFEGDTRINVIAELIPTWHELGARIFGGCCRVLPNHIRQIAESCQKLKEKMIT
uniref:Hcy-binding domain-containing protein n=1 Tax=Ditylenchus dipsaci TaxID=166011 RepID=A0A915DYG1_9BILA